MLPYRELLAVSLVYECAFIFQSIITLNIRMYLSDYYYYCKLFN